MKSRFMKALGLVTCIGLLGSPAISQQNQDKGRLNDNEEIIIRKKSDKDTKVTVEIKDGEVKVNGKPLSEFEDDNVVIRRRQSPAVVRAYTAPRSPFQGGTLNFNDNDGARTFRYNSNVNLALLGVMTEKDEKGAKVNSVSKGSAAEKAGLKAGDIITKVENNDIGSPEDLTAAVAKFKPEDKASITFLRDKKEQKVTATLGRRAGADNYFPENFDFNRNFNFDMDTQGFGRLAPMLRGAGPKLGIKAQETEDGKGVKVLGVDEESNAAKAGIKEGDIITDFDSKTVNSADDLMQASSGFRDKSSIKIKVLRNGKSQDMEVKIPKKLKTATL